MDLYDSIQSALQVGVKYNRDIYCQTSMSALYGTICFISCHSNLSYDMRRVKLIVIERIFSGKGKLGKENTSAIISGCSKLMGIDRC